MGNSAQNVEDERKTPLELLTDPNQVIITEGGMETQVLFGTKYPMKDFCLFEILINEDKQWQKTITSMFREQAEKLSRYKDLCLMFDTPTWRMSSDWMEKIGVKSYKLPDVANNGVKILKEIRDSIDIPMIIGGEIGPRGDGYAIDAMMSSVEAEYYHLPSIYALKTAGVDIINALTLNYLDEALGIATACSKLDIPYSLVFTLETDGKLPNKASLEETIEQCDDYLAKNELKGPIFYGINCSHPTHCVNALTDKVKEKVLFMRGNPSKMSHEELDNATELDGGVPSEFADDMIKMKEEWGLKIIGGCCGSDSNHLVALAEKLFTK